jgi:hypothetical protein
MRGMSVERRAVKCPYASNSAAVSGFEHQAMPHQSASPAKRPVSPPISTQPAPSRHRHLDAAAENHEAFVTTGESCVATSTTMETRPGAA